MKGRLLFYVLTASIPLFLGAIVRQSVRYAELVDEVKRVEAAQEEWVESNKRLIAGIAVLSSSERIEGIAKNELGLVKKPPEAVLQIRIEGGRELDG
ncbi:MAG: septum formation initiator family protein [Spirochaetaceae bacterium]|jgi:cell division protein FtsL|nr:septum formation initiator family protein [Spirochaetaceae bacterium]